MLRCCLSLSYHEALYNYEIIISKRKHLSITCSCYIGPVAITNGTGPVLGGKPFQLTGPCLPRTTGLKCKVGSTVIPGKRIRINSDLLRVECISPLSLETGRVPVALSVDGGRTYPFTASYLYGKKKYTV